MQEKIDALNLFPKMPRKPKAGDKWVTEIMTKRNSEKSFYYFECISAVYDNNSFPQVVSEITLKVIKK